MARSNEPIFWSLFAAGGMVAAMLLPITVVLTGIAVPAGWLSADRLLEVVTSPLGKLYIFVLVFLPLCHAAHRLVVTLKDMGVKAETLVFGLCWGGAAAGTATAAYALLTL